MEQFQVFSNPKEIYADMIDEIQNAKKSVYLETYIYDNDSVGKLFRKELLKKSKQGVKVYLLIDSWGSSVKKDFFKELIKSGARIMFFKEFQYVARIFSKNHERNHRKILVIDKKISYIGSMNITESCLDWRELVLKISGEISLNFIKSFKRSWNLSAKLSKRKIQKIIHRGFEILHDVPRNSENPGERNPSAKKYIQMIKKSRKSICIETPYFVPSWRLRHELYKAVRRGVKVKIVLPHISDVKVTDILRNRYLGTLNKHGIKIFYYLPRTLHSKLLIVDNKFFLLGSSNLDYRSFIHQHELNLFGTNKEIISELRKHFQESQKDSEKFDYSRWKHRSSLKKITEMILSVVESYF